MDLRIESESEISNPTNLSKAKAYLKRYESFENKSIYLDSAWNYLSKSENNVLSKLDILYILTYLSYPAKNNTPFRGCYPFYLVNIPT